MTDDDHDNDAPLSRDELLAEAHEAARKWAWQPGEREAIEAEMAERQIQIDAERIMAGARQAAAARPVEPWRSGAPDAVITKSRAAPAAAVPASMTQQWQRYIERRIRRQIDKHEKEALLPGIAEVLVKEEKARATADDALRQEQRSRTAELETQIAELKAQIERLEAGAKSTPLKLAAG